MRQEHDLSDEFVNAFVDDQMMPGENARVCERLAFDEAFNQRVCELRKIRDLIRLAYRDLPQSGLSDAIASVKTRTFL